MIRSVAIQGFRGIPSKLELNCGRITLLSGQNGLGKTTFFDAIDWCIFGSSWRLGSEDAAIKNLYTDVTPMVELVLESNGGLTRIQRTPTGASLNGESINDRALIEAFITDTDVFGPYARNIDSRVRPLVYLPQADVRELVSPQSGDARAAMLQALLGVPNASVLQSGLRRASDRVFQRMNLLLQKLEQVSADRVHLESQLITVHAENRNAADEIESEVRELLGKDAARLVATDTLLSLVTSERAISQQDVRKTRDSIAALVRNEERQASLTGIIDLRRNAVNAAEESLKEMQAKLGQSDDGVSALVKELKLLEAEQQRYQTVLSLQAGLERLFAEVRQLEEEARTAHARSEEHSARAAKLDDRLVSQAGQIEAQNHTITALQEEFQARSEEIAAAQAQLARVRQRKQLQMQLDSLKQELHGVVSALRTLNDDEAKSAATIQALQRVTSDALRHDDLDKHLEYLAKHHDVQTEPPDCPLCGTPFENRAKLLDHISRTLEERRSRKTTQERAAQDLRQLQEEAEIYTRRKDTLTTKQRNLEERQILLLNQISTLHVEPVDERDLLSKTARLDELAAALKRAQETAEELKRGQETIEKDRQVALAEAQQAQEATKAANQKRQERLDTLQPEDTQTLVAQNSIEARTQIAAIEERIGIQAERLGQERKKNEDLRNAVAAALRERGNATAALKGVEEELQSLRRELIQHATAFSAPKDPPIPVLLKISRDHLAETEHRETRLQKLERDLQARKVEEETVLHKNTRDQLVANERQLQQDLTELKNANNRLTSIGDAIRARATLEGREALGRYRGSIQRCLDAFCPHKHLNKLEIEEVSGRFSLTDSYLRTAVAPDLFTSTGQLNALALAIFLGIASAQSVTTMEFLLLDEPVQNLDDVHFLALVTLLKRVALTSQVIISTADKNIAEIIHRQIESTWYRTEEDYAHHKWVAFSPQDGPSVIAVPIRASAVA